MVGRSQERIALVVVQGEKTLANLFDERLEPFEPEP